MILYDRGSLVMLVLESRWGARWWEWGIANPATDIRVCICLYHSTLTSSKGISTSRDTLTCLYSSVYVVWVSAVGEGLTHCVLTTQPA